MKKFTNNMLAAVMITAGIALSGVVSAQTDLDAIMMNKKQFCQGLAYDYSSWDHYWEGTFKRNNENLGTVSTQALMYMPNYGITNNLNVMASVPYVWTKATQGTLHGVNGLQDLSVFVKWRPLMFSSGKNKFSLFAIGGFFTPLSNYIVDYLPLSIGLGSTNLSARGMIDYRHDHFTVTGSATYTWRSNVKIDQSDYYDTELHQTNEIEMPNVVMYQLRTGYRGKYLIAEAVLTKTNTLGGYDIQKNGGQLYPNLKMNSTVVGGSFKYTLKKLTNVAFTGGINYVVAGRNVGQSTAFSVGAYYAFYFGNKTKP